MNYGETTTAESSFKLIVSNLGAAIQSVMLPVLSASQTSRSV